MKIHKRLRRRLKTIGLSSQHAASLSWYCQRQLVSQGIVRGTAFLKDAGDTIIAKLSGSGKKPSWVKTRFGYPVAFAFIRHYPLDIQLRVAKIARSVVFSAVTRQQESKLVDAVVNEFSGDPTVFSEVASLIRLGFPERCYSVSKKDLESPAYPRVTDAFSKTASTGNRVQLQKDVPLAQSIELLSMSTTFRMLPDWVKTFLPLDANQIFAFAGLPVNRLPLADWDIPVGEIHASQEGGGKLRMFASPFTVFQALLTPLHQYLTKVRRLISTDCTYNQSAGMEWAWKRIQSGQTVCSVDLTTATCRFPLDPQLEVLRLLSVPQEWIDALVLVCRGRWIVGNELPFKLRELRWKVGQPLGIRPSMSLFSLTHNLLLRGLCRQLRISVRDSFRVLGDDVVMVEELFTRYTQVIERLGVPVSWSKTHVSNSFAEFAGYSITPEVVVRPGKWKPASVDNHIELACELGTPLYKEVSSSLVLVEKLALFGLGLFNPPIHEWSKYIRANTALSEHSLDLSLPPGKCMVKAAGLSRLVERLYRPRVAPRIIEQVDPVYRILSAMDEFTVDIQYRMLSSMLGDMHPQYWVSSTLTWCHMHVLAALRRCEITLEDAQEVIRLLENRAYSLYYLPPRKPKNRFPRTRKYIEVLMDSFPSASLSSWIIPAGGSA